MTDMEKVRKYLPTDELLCQLAEEAAELSKAALKLRRAMTAAAVSLYKEATNE